MNLPTEYTKAKFWVAFVGALLTTASLLGLPGWWGKGIGIAVALFTSAGVYLQANTPIPDATVPPAPTSGVHSG